MIFLIAVYDNICFTLHKRSIAVMTFHKCHYNLFTKELTLDNHILHLFFQIVPLLFVYIGLIVAWNYGIFIDVLLLKSDNRQLLLKLML